MGATCCNVPVTKYRLIHRFGGWESGYLCTICSRTRIPLNDTVDPNFGKEYRKDVKCLRQWLAAQGDIKWSDV